MAAMLARRPIVRRPLTAGSIATRGQIESVLHLPVAQPKLTPKDQLMAYPQPTRGGVENPVHRTSRSSGDEPLVEQRSTSVDSRTASPGISSSADSPLRETGPVTASHPSMPADLSKTWAGWGTSSPSKLYSTLPAPMVPPRVRSPPGLAAMPRRSGAKGFENTVIIFDWDDTLLCSSALHNCQLDQFAELEQVVESLLLSSMDMGRTIIVTNAMDTWIQESASRFMPKLLPTLVRLSIVYARTNHERLYPGDAFAWKREAFREVLRYWVGRDLNLVVLGDSLSEIRAAEAMAKSLGSAAAVKTVKFKALPSLSDLLGQLRAVTPELGRLVGEPRSSSKALVSDWTPGAYSTLTKGPQRWSLVDAAPGSCNALASPAGVPLGPSLRWHEATQTFPARHIYART